MIQECLLLCLNYHSYDYPRAFIGTSEGARDKSGSDFQDPKGQRGRKGSDRRKVGRFS